MQLYDYANFRDAIFKYLITLFINLLLLYCCIKYIIRVWVENDYISKIVKFSI